jgi:dTDP-4-amino-4,6-dideoxygalactose transaminase
MRKMTIPFARPFVGEEEEQACLKALRSGWLTTGQETILFEKEFECFLSERGSSPLRTLAVNSATSGLHLALEACGVQAGDCVLTPAYTFTASAEVSRYLGAEPVFVDNAPGTFHMDACALEATIKRLLEGKPAYAKRGGFGPQGKPKAVMPVHYGGLPCDMDALMEIARAYDLKVVEDAAHSFPSQLKNGVYAGTIGDAGVFSFYATKTLTTGEGGMVATRNSSIADRIAVMRTHGIDRTIWNRYVDTKATWAYRVIEAGYKYNLPDILSALGRAQLRRAVDLLTMRMEIAAQYDEAFAGDERFIIPPTGAGDARHLYPLRLNPSFSRDFFVEWLQSCKVGVSVHFIPLHTMPYYKKRYGFEDNDFPEAFKTFQQEVSLPIWPGMSPDQVAYVIKAVKEFEPPGL